MKKILSVLLAVLTVMNPLDDGQDRMQERRIVQAVLAIEPNALRIMLAGKVMRMHQSVTSPEQGEDTFPFFIIDFLETSGRHLPEGLKQRLVDKEIFLTVRPRAAELTFSQTVVLQYGVSKPECGIDQNPVRPVQHLSVHCAH